MKNKTSKTDAPRPLNKHDVGSMWPNCTPTELRVLIRELKTGIKQCKSEKEMTAKSWGYQNGVLISGDDAVIFLKMCEALKAKLS